MNTFLHHSRDHSNTMIEDDDLCEQIHCMQNLMIETNLNSPCDVTNRLEEDEDDHMMMLHSPSSPRMTICRIPAHEEQGPIAPLLRITPSSPIPSQFQRDDKILRWQHNTTQSLSSVYFPSLPVDRASTNTMIHKTSHKNHRLSDLSSLPLPKRIRLLPRRRKPVPRTFRN